MNRYVFLLFFSGLSLTAQADQTQEWLTDVPTALQKAKQENKILLLDFTGSDWCGWCVKLKN